MVRIISALTALLLSTAVFGQAGDPAPAASRAEVQQEGNVLQIRPDAPERYTVVRGDTLWHIAGRYLNTPWRWPELWRMNQEQIRNPHLIYPGDVLVLDRATGTLSVERLAEDRLQPRIYEESLRQAIPSIPMSEVEPFLSQPLIVDLGDLSGTPRIVGVQNGRVMLGTGDDAFVTGLREAHQAWQVYRPGKLLVDPESGADLGYEAIYLGDAELRRSGEPALVTIRNSKLEIGRGDRLVRQERLLLTNFVPHRPADGFRAQVLSVYGKGTMAGQYQIITLNRGRSDGIEPGHVLALLRPGRTVTMRDEQMAAESVALPEDRYGLAMVFRAFDRVAYALIMHTDSPTVVGDLLRTP